MANTINKKQNLAMQALLKRQDYLVTQGNDLARAFGNLTSFEHKVLDYCFSFVKSDSKLEEAFNVSTSDILHHLGLSSQGKNYRRVGEAFKRLNEQTALYLSFKNQGGKVVLRMAQLFEYIDFVEDGAIHFKFSRPAAPYVFQLRKNFYSFHLSELANVSSKYALTMMKLWNANSNGKLESTSIKGSIADWQSWFLGSNSHGDPIHWQSGRFKQKVLGTAISELGKLYPQTLFTLMTNKQGRAVTGYQLDITNIHTSLKL